MRNLLWTVIALVSLGKIGMGQENPKFNFIDIKQNQPVSEVLIGRALAIQVTGLPGGTPITLTCDNGLSKSSANFISDSQGQVDLSKQAPISGSYSGVDPDGMFWSREPISKVSSGTKPGPFTCRAFIEHKEVATGSIKKLYQLPRIKNIRLTKSEVGFEALLSLPDGKGPFPALFVVGGSEGGLDEFSPPYFASLGYATLSVAYYAMPGLPEEINQIPLEYFKRAIDWLKIQKSVNAKRVGLIGSSRGGELAMVLASTFPSDFTAVVANQPSGVVWSSIVPSSGLQHSSWTFKNQEIPAVPFTEEAPHKENYPDGREIVTYSNIFLDALKNDAAVRKATIPVEKFRGPLLILAGRADQIWPSCALSEYAIKRRKQFNLDKKDLYYCFENAGHTIGIPGAPLMDLTFYHPVAKEFWNAGGTPAGNAKAQRIGWDAVIQFLRDNI
ncbi:MAG: acyl-CoA thioester hydrolase/BAAT C-terminal domain-containing protein [Pseudobdellovibrionaceae bacterium]